MQPQNDVQGMMRRWTSLLPYNALHLLRLAERADLDRWREAATTPLTELGFELPRTITKYPEFGTGVQAELNRPFRAGESPLRFFVIEGGGGSQHLGVTFDHWIADSESVRFLMQRILERYRAPDSTSLLPPLRVCDKPFHEIFGRVNPALAVADGLRNFLRHQRAYRIHIREPSDFSCGFQHLQLPDGLVGKLHRFGRQLGGTVNDIFLAAVAQALGAHTATDRTRRSSRMLRPKRDRVALSTAMDIRPLANVPLDQQFGVFMSCFHVLLKSPEADPLPDLIRQISAYTRAMKLSRRALNFFQAAKMANMSWDQCCSPSRRVLLLHKITPLLGGISNVNLTHSWVERDEGVLDYIRISPIGPLVPIIFTLTTIRDRLSLCVTHRTSVFTDIQAAALASDFVGRLNELTESGPS